MSRALSPPLVRKELRDMLRGHAAFALESGNLLVAAIVALVACSTTAMQDGPTWGAGQSAFWTLLIIEAALGAILGAAITSPTITGEREQKTLDILVTTPLDAGQVVWGKLLSSFAYLATVILVAVPVAAGAFVLGGVSLGAGLAATVLLFGGLAVGVAIGAYCSVLAGRTAAAAALAFGAAVALLVVGMARGAAGPLSPVAAVVMIRDDAAVAVYCASLPVLVVSLVYWALLVFLLAEGAAQGLRHPEHRRLWGVRWRFALVIAAALIVGVGCLGLKGGAGFG